MFQRIVVELVASIFFNWMKKGKSDVFNILSWISSWISIFLMLPRRAAALLGQSHHFFSCTFFGIIFFIIVCKVFIELCMFLRFICLLGCLLCNKFPSVILDFSSNSLWPQHGWGVFCADLKQESELRRASLISWQLLQVIEKELLIQLSLWLMISTLDQ